MTDLKQHIRDLAAAGTVQAIADRRHLHQHPELSFEERETAAYVARQLTAAGIAQRSIAETGVLGEIRGGRPGPTIALRADLDALPIQEANDVPYRSTKPGVMHACGHDVHTASLLATARILQQVRDQLPGTVRLLFQPGEEKLPGGANLMIRDGAISGPTPAAIFGQHVHPPLPAGSVGFRPGIYMASTDELFIRVEGRGGHGAMPHQAVDPITITAQVVSALQLLISRESDPTLPVVMTFGHIASDGGATNVIPNAVELQGTLRTLDEAWRRELHLRIKRTAEGIAAGLGGRATVRIGHGYPFLKNDEALTHRAKAAAIDFLGAERVHDLPIRMTGEDFAFYSHHLPACFYRLGVSNAARGIGSPVHTDTFDVDEAALETGAGLMAWLVVGG